MSYLIEFKRGFVKFFSYLCSLISSVLNLNQYLNLIEFETKEMIFELMANLKYKKLLYHEKIL